MKFTIPRCSIAYADTGDNMNISRQHAKIAYNFSLGKQRQIVTAMYRQLEPLMQLTSEHNLQVSLS